MNQPQKRSIKYVAMGAISGFCLAFATITWLNIGLNSYLIIGISIGALFGFHAYEKSDIGFGLVYGLSAGFGFSLDYLVSRFAYDPDFTQIPSHLILGSGFALITIVILFLGVLAGFINAHILTKILPRMRKE